MTNNSYSTNTTTVLSGFLCMYLNLPSEHLECSTITTTNSSPPQATQCIYCPAGHGSVFSTGEGLNEFYSKGHLTALVINSFTGIIGILGTLLGWLIIAVLRKQKKSSGGASSSSFDMLLATLAWFDIAVCVCCLIYGVSAISWFQNWTRGLVPLVCLLGRTHVINVAGASSCLITIAITVERLIAITFPLQARVWFTPTKSKGLVGVVAIYSCFNSMARLLASGYIGKNNVDPGIKGTAGLEYLIHPSDFEYLFTPFVFFDILVPVPVLLILNGLIFYKIREISASRKELSSTQTQELNAGKMILPNVAVQALSSIFPIVLIYSLVDETGTELKLFLGLVCALNSAVNFPIYYWNSEGFRREAKAVLATTSFGRCARK